MRWPRCRATSRRCCTTRPSTSGSPTNSPRRGTCSISAAAAAIPLALEGALKLKEISYIHAEGYAAGELKHGPIALIDENVPVIVVAPADELFEKTVSNMQEVAARGGKIMLLSDAPAERAGCALEAHIQVPTVHPFVNPCSTRFRCSSSPTIRRCSWAPTWTSRAILPNRLLWNRAITRPPDLLNPCKMA